MHRQRYFLENYISKGALEKNIRAKEFFRKIVARKSSKTIFKII